MMSLLSSLPPIWEGGSWRGVFLFRIFIESLVEAFKRVAPTPGSGLRVRSLQLLCIVQGREMPFLGDVFRQKDHFTFPVIKIRLISNTWLMF